MDLKVHEPCVDLREMSELVLGGPGCGSADIAHRRSRIRQRRRTPPIASKTASVTSVFRLAWKQHPPRPSRATAIIRLLLKPGRIQGSSRSIRSWWPTTHPNINPDEAYLVGLFHAIGLLPSVLGWDWHEPGPVDETLAGFSMAKRWALPQCVIEFFSEAHLPSAAPGRWSDIVRMAHQLSTRSSINCFFEQGLRPQLIGASRLA